MRMMLFSKYLHLEALPDKLKSEDSACLPPAAPRVLLEDAREPASSHPIRKDLFACLEGLMMMSGKDSFQIACFFGGEGAFSFLQLPQERSFGKV